VTTTLHRWRSSSGGVTFSLSQTRLLVGLVYWVSRIHLQIYIRSSSSATVTILVSFFWLMDEPWWASELCSGTGDFLEGAFSQVLVFSQITPHEVICFLSIWLPSVAFCPSVQTLVLVIIVTPYWFLGCSSVQCHFFTASWLRSCRRQRQWLF